MFSPNNIDRNTIVLVKESRETDQVAQRSLGPVIDEYLDGIYEPTALVELRPGGGFSSLKDLIAENPVLISERSIHVQRALLLGPPVLVLFALVYGTPAAIAQSLVLVAAFVAFVVIRSRPLLRGMGTVSLLRAFWKNRTARTAGLAFVGVCQVVALALGAVEAGRRDTARNTIAMALNASDPCAARKLDQNLLSEYGSAGEKQKYRDRDDACVRREQSSTQAQLQQAHAEACRKVTAALEKKIAPAPSDLPKDADGALYKRIVEHQLERQDLSLKPSNLGCEGAWPFFVQAARTTLAWAKLEKREQVSRELLEQIAAKKLEPAAASALKARADAVVAESSKYKAAFELQETQEFCALTLKLAGDVPASCKLLEQRVKALKSSEEAQAKAREAAENAKESRCDAIRTARRACGDRCEATLDLNDPRLDACIARCGEGALTGRVPGCD